LLETVRLADAKDNRIIENKNAKKIVGIFLFIFLIVIFVVILELRHFINISILFLFFDFYHWSPI
jgi:uncharacterized membrane protein